MLPAAIAYRAGLADEAGRQDCEWSLVSYTSSAWERDWLEAGQARADNICPVRTHRSVLQNTSVLSAKSQPQQDSKGSLAHSNRRCGAVTVSSRAEVNARPDGLISPADVAMPLLLTAAVASEPGHAGSHRSDAGRLAAS